jgi:hypothetical protein
MYLLKPFKNMAVCFDIFCLFTIFIFMLKVSDVWSQPPTEKELGQNKPPQEP